MADEDHLVGGPDYNPRRTALRGRVKRAPVNVGDAMTVVSINYSEESSYEVPGTNWNPVGESIPIEGTTCLIVFDDDGDAWIPTWAVHAP